MSGNSFVQSATARTVKYIKPVPRGAASALVAAIYRQAEREFALVPPITLHSPAPDILAGVWMFTREAFIVGRDGRMDREIVAAAVSQLNACPFCVEVHTAMLHGGGERALAAQFTDERGNGSPHALAEWALATTTPGALILAAPPFTAPASVSIIGTAILFHFINRMVNVFLESSPSPVSAPLLKRAFGHVFGAVVGRKLVSVDAEPGLSVALLPHADLPAEFAWAVRNPAIASAVARFSAVVEAEGERVLSDAVRSVVLNEVQRWNGADPGLSPAWVDVTLAPLKWESERRAGRLALLTALASYRVDAGVVETFRQDAPSDRELVAATAWASLQATKRISTWMAPELGSPRQATG